MLSTEKCYHQENKRKWRKSETWNIGGVQEKLMKKHKRKKNIKSQRKIDGRKKEWVKDDWDTERIMKGIEVK